MWCLNMFNLSVQCIGIIGLSLGQSFPNIHRHSSIWTLASTFLIDACFKVLYTGEWVSSNAIWKCVKMTSKKKETKFNLLKKMLPSLFDISFFLYTLWHFIVSSFIFCFNLFLLKVASFLFLIWRMLCREKTLDHC